MVKVGRTGRRVVRVLAVVAGLLASLLVAGPRAVEAEVVAETPVPLGSTWRYLDDGSNQGVAWSAAGFDDAGWAAGPGELGYGDGDEATVVGFGPDADLKYATTYFRHSFTVADVYQFVSATARLKYDDGAAVYLNGTEIWRSDNLPAAAAFDVYADPDVTDENAFASFAFDATLLVEGQNTFAVEVHQGPQPSSDISMAFELTVDRDTDVPPPGPVMGADAYAVAAGDNLAGSIAGNDVAGLNYSTDPADLPDPATEGTLTIDGAGAFSWTPVAGFVGIITVPVTGCDAVVADFCSVRDLVIDVRGVLAVDDQAQTNLDTPVSGNVGDNDDDQGNGALTFSLTSGPDPAAGGSLSFGADGGWSFTPAAGFSGVVSAGYEACDAQGDCGAATLMIVIDNNVVISEIHFHPECDVSYTPCQDSPREFVEVYNKGDFAMDISGWRFSDGVSFAFPSGTTLGAFQRLVVASDGPGFQAEFGFNPYVFDGSLSNSGERLALSNPAGQEADSVTYTDGSDTPGEWSVGADGDGWSLQLVNADGDNAGARYWVGATPTPGDQNAGEGEVLAPSLEDLTWTVLPGAGEDLVVSAKVFGGGAVEIDYRINYPGSTQTVAMSSNDGVTYTGSVPASAYGAGDLVRLRVVVDNTTVAPKSEDTIGWFGTTVEDPAINSNLAHLEWFTSTGNYNSGYAEQGSTLYDGVLAYDGVVYDNVGFRIRGAIARSSSWTKRNWKFKLPDHHNIQIAGFSYGVDTIDLQGGFADEARIREYIGHTIAGEMGVVASQVEHVRLDLNGEFFGLHTFQEHPDGGFLKENGLDNASLFQGAQSANYAFQAGPPASPNWSPDNEDWDIPDYINMLAAASIIQNNDFAHNNFIWWLDRDEHGRYEGMVWDLDLSQGIRYAPTDGLTTRLLNGNVWSHVWLRWSGQTQLFDDVLSNPTWRQMYLRRVQVLADEWYGTGRLETLARDTYANLSAEWVADTQRWGFWGGQNYSQQRAIDRYADDWIDQFYAHIQGGGPNGDIPGPQPANPNITITVEHAPADQRNEHIRLINNENVAIDVSGWRITGSANLVLPPGSVIPSNGSVYVVDDDLPTGFRSVTNDLIVLGQYAASLPNDNGWIGLGNANGGSVDLVTWGDVQTPSLILNEWNAVSGSNLIEDADPFFGPVAGNGGDWFELVVVEDQVDLRGYQLEIADADNNAGQLEVTDTFVFTDDPLFASVRSGTIITIAEDVADDVSYNPAGGDWTINLQANSTDDGGYITSESQSNFDTNSNNWQLRILNPGGSVVFGPAGEGANNVSGVGSSEVGELEAHPSVVVDLGTYGDSRGSTFAAPNVFGETPQDFAPLRAVVPAGDATIGDSVSFADGTPAAGVGIDVYTADVDGNRIEWLNFTTTNAAGNYSFTVGAGCYAVVFIAPAGELFVGGLEFLEVPLCVAAGETNDSIDAVLISDGGGGESIGDSVTFDDGIPAAGVAIDLYSADAVGERIVWLQATTAGVDGSYRFDVDPGCYAVVFIAPDGETFVGGGQYLERALCLIEGESDDSIDAVLQTAGGGGTSIGDAVMFDDGAPAAGVSIDLFAADAALNKGEWQTFTTTAADGSYNFDVAAGCYVVVFIAPAGEVFVNGTEFTEQGLCLAAGETNDTIDAVIQTDGGGGDATIGDMVTALDGAGVSGIAIDLFAADAAGNRAEWLTSTSTDVNGLYSLTVSAGCYAVVFIAPDGETFVGGAQYNEQPLCVVAGETNDTIDATLDRPGNGASAGIGDTVTDPAGGVADVAIDLYAAAADGSRGEWLTATTTAADGTYNFTVTPACYVVVFVAPDGRTFTNGTAWTELSFCVADGETNNDIDATLN